VLPHAPFGVHWAMQGALSEGAAKAAVPSVIITDSDMIIPATIFTMFFFIFVCISPSYFF
jgi:hypothetical protein